MTAVAAVILAAGGSSRLGRPKQLVEINGRSLVRRAVDVAAAAGRSPIVVVLGRDAQACTNALAGAAVVVVHNELWQAGMGTSIRAGFAALPPEVSAAVLMLCDQPHVSADTLRVLEAVALRSGSPVVVAEYAGTVGPPVRVTGSVLNRLRSWPLSEGAKSLWLQTPHNVARVACPEAATDVDTEADVAALSDGRRH